MQIDKFGHHIYSEADITDVLLSGREFVAPVVTEIPITVDPHLELESTAEFVHYESLNLPETIEEFDNKNQAAIWMPEEYKNLDIVQFLLEQCTTEAQLQRVGEELLLYVDRDLLPLLQYLKFFVDTARVNNIVWGVGRGSSVASYVLFLIGVHKIDSLYYDLDIRDFLR
jgi:DNA polymerase III alpha subunit